MSVLAIIFTVLGVAGFLYWIFSTFEFLDLFSFAFVSFAVVMLSLFTLYLLRGGSPDHG